MQYSTPILFLIFNRPEVTFEVFQRIREIQPEFLFIAADGPRVNKPGEEELCMQARSIKDKVDWPCSVQLLYRTQNLGCAKGVSAAINWFFEHVDQGIILEDDCMPDLTFFTYCEELLDRYKPDKEIGAISGFNNQIGISRTKYSYYFSRLPSSWGWATWADRWAEYNKIGDHPSEQLISEPAIVGLKNEIIDTLLGKIDSWGYRWVYAFYKNRFLSIYPNVSLIKNIGFSEDATHTKGQRWWYKFIRYGKIINMMHPPAKNICEEADRLSVKLNMSLKLSLKERVQFNWYRWIVNRR